jgi:hypothetical protein
MPDAWLCELGEGGHFGHIEEAHAFASAVLDLVHNQGMEDCS